MKITGIIRRVDDLGRIVIPKEIRKLVFGKPEATGEPMEIFIDGENIVLRRYEEIQTCKWIKYDYRTICPKNHDDADDPYWRIHENMANIKYCPYCGKVCGFVFADRFVSELGNRLCKMHPEIDFVAMIDIDGCTVSYRTVKEDIDLGKDVASLFGGGGHSKAAGSEFSQTIKLKVIGEIFGQ